MEEHSVPVISSQLQGVSANHSRAKPDIKNKINQQPAVLIHAQRANVEARQFHLQHFKGYQNCNVARSTSRQIISHWKQCKRPGCHICLPLNKLITSQSQGVFANHSQANPKIKKKTIKKRVLIIFAHKSQRRDNQANGEASANNITQNATGMNDMNNTVNNQASHRQVMNTETLGTENTAPMVITTKHLCYIKLNISHKGSVMVPGKQTTKVQEEATRQHDNVEYEKGGPQPPLMQRQHMQIAPPAPQQVNQLVTDSNQMFNPSHQQIFYVSRHDPNIPVEQQESFSVIVNIPHS